MRPVNRSEQKKPGVIQCFGAGLLHALTFDYRSARSGDAVVTFPSS
jgi:hypothetical protein